MTTAEPRIRAGDRYRYTGPVEFDYAVIRLCGDSALIEYTGPRGTNGWPGEAGQRRVWRHWQTLFVLRSVLSSGAWKPSL